MANIKIRHFVERNGCYYWQPATALRQQGWKCRRLPNSLEAAIAEAEKINAELDNWRAGKADITSVPVSNSVNGLIAAYQRSNAYRSLAEKTRRDYDYRLSIIEKWAGKVPVQGITCAAVQTFWEALAKKSEYKANATVRVLRLILNYAVKPLGWIQINPASRPGLANIAPRSVVWTVEEVSAAVATADRLGYFNLGTAILLGAFIAQREGDILRLSWDDLQNGAFLVHQSKTGAYVAVPVHPVLRDRLNMYSDKTGLIIKSDLDDKPYTQSAFTHRFDIVRKAVAQDIPAFTRCQFLDLRRTAVVRLAEAGCTEAQISAVSGHKIDTCRRILETYLPRNSTMAREAINKYVAYLPAA